MSRNTLLPLWRGYHGPLTLQRLAALFTLQCPGHWSRVTSLTFERYPRGPPVDSVPVTSTLRGSEVKANLPVICPLERTLAGNITFGRFSFVDK